MRYAGGLVRHLGLQMYAGFIPAIAELVSNAWDADASDVRVELPLGEAITEDSVVVVADNGTGMTFEEVNEAYLVLGRDRRAATGTGYSKSGRRVMGRKGIGKLAGFGIAHLMQIETIRDGWLTSFQMDYDEILSQAGAALVKEYEPAILEDRSVRGEDRPDGTTITLSRLQGARKQINSEQFARNMRRRFSILGKQFQVTVNGDPLADEPLAWQFRFPAEGVNSEDVPGFGTVRWWVGFTEKPIPHDDARGIAVLARGKLVQRPFFFDLSGGMTGQHGLQYMTGEVTADALDDESRDLIATDRATILWEDPSAEPLLAWGQGLVRARLKDWTDGREQANVVQIERAFPELQNLGRLPERARKELTGAIKALQKVDTIDQERLEELVRFLVQAYDNDLFMTLVRDINAADAEVAEDLVKLFSEWDVQEAVSLAWIVRGRVEIIRQFERMIAEKVPEKPDMQDFVKEHPWLLGPSFDPMRHETSLDRVIREEIGVEPDTAEGSRRLDFFTLADSTVAYVVELKRPGLAVGKAELRQLEDYVSALANHYEKVTDPEGRKTVRGILIGSTIKASDLPLFKRAALADNVTKTWRGLLEEAERTHRDYLKVVQSRAPQDDPRIDALDDPTG